jgi:chloramphenicol O-acetyltransferase type B
MILKKKYFYIINVINNILTRILSNKSLHTFNIQNTVKSYGENLKVNFKCEGFHKNVILGNNVNLNGMRIFGTGNVQIGNYFHSGEKVTLITSNHNFNGDDMKAIPYDKKRLDKSIIIEDFVWIGFGVTIMPGITIGEGSVISANSVVSKDVPKYAVFGGHPAKVIMFRNIDLFLKLKNENKFF